MANWRGCQSLLTMASSGELTYVIACLLPLSLRDFATLPQGFCKYQHQNTDLINCGPTVTGLASEATCMVVDRMGDRGISILKSWDGVCQLYPPSHGHKESRRVYFISRPPNWLLEEIPYVLFKNNVVRC